MRTSYENHPVDNNKYCFTQENNAAYNVKYRTDTHQHDKKTKHDIINNILLCYEEILDCNVDQSKVKQISYKDLTIIIEEIYNKAYQLVLENQNDNNTEEADENEILDVVTILKNFLNEKFEDKEDLINLMCSSIVFSCHTYAEQYCDCELFLRFQTREFNAKELKFFIFVRAIIEKEIKKKFFETNTNKRIDTRASMIDSDQIYAILNATFGFGKSVRQSRFIKQLAAFDENYRQKQKINVYKFLYVALYDFFTYERYKGKDSITNEVGSQYLDIGTKKKQLNPKMYQQGVSNLRGKTENHLKKSEKAVNHLDLNELHPRKNIYKDFEEQYDNDDYRACYANSSSAKKKYNEMVWLKEENKSGKKMLPINESEEQYEINNKVDEFISGEKIDPKYEKYNLQDEIEQNDSPSDKNEDEHTIKESENKKIINIKSNRNLFDNISIEGTAKHEDNYDGPSITLTDNVAFYDFDSFEKAVIENVSKSLKNLIGAMVNYNLQENFDSLFGGVDHKLLIYDIIWPKVSKIVESIYEKDEDKFKDQLGLSKSDDCRSFENLKMMCEMLRSDFEEKKSDNDNNIVTLAKQIFQIDTLATEIARQGTIISASIQFTN